MWIDVRLVAKIQKSNNLWNQYQAQSMPFFATCAVDGLSFNIQLKTRLDPATQPLVVAVAHRPLVSDFLTFRLRIF